VSSQLDERDTRLQHVPVCPHCGYKHKDAWEWNFGPGVEGDTEHRCDSCDRDFHVQREVSIYYTTQATP